MKNLWLDYYSSMFNVLISEVFLKLCGSTEDIYGCKYTEVFKRELLVIKKDFIELMYSFNKLNLPYHEDVIAINLLRLFKPLNINTSSEGAQYIARLIINYCNLQVSFNKSNHPLSKQEHPDYTDIPLFLRKYIDNKNSI